MGAFNHGRYFNSAFDDLTRRALSTMDEPTRITLMQETVKVVTDDVAMVPLFRLRNIRASRRGIVRAARRDTWSVLSGTRLAP